MKYIKAKLVDADIASDTSPTSSNILNYKMHEKHFPIQSLTLFHTNEPYSSKFSSRLPLTLFSFRV